MSSAKPQPASQAPPIPTGWIEGSALGVSARRVNQLFHQLRPLGAAQKRGRIYLFQRNHPAVVPLVERQRRDESYRLLDGFSEARIAEARRKLRVYERGVRAIADHMQATGCGRTAAVQWFCSVGAPRLAAAGEIELTAPLTPRTWRLWDKRYRAAGGRRLLAFIDQRGRPAAAESQCTPAAWNHFKLLYLDDRKPSVRVCWEDTSVESARQGWSWLSYRACCARVQRDIPKATLVLKREGRRQWEAQVAPRIRRVIDVPAGDTWVGDEHTMKLYCRLPDGNGGWKRGRPTLTAWLDLRSRLFTGWHISPTGNSDSILASFKAGVLQYGPPRKVHIDNGADYKSVGGRPAKKKWHDYDPQRLANVFAELGVEAVWAIPYAPWAKMIESHFRLVVARFARRMRSYCGNKPEDRPDGAMQIPIMALPTLDEVREAFAEWLPTIHDLPREGDGMHGRTPNEVWAAHRGPVVRAIPDAAMLDYLCAKVVTKPVKVSKDGVRHQGLHYGASAPELWKLFGQQVRIKVHPETRDFVDVISLDGRPICRARHDRLDGTQPTDIAKAASRRKAALKAAREAQAAVAVIRRSPVAAVRAEQRQRQRDERAAQQPPAPPKLVAASEPPASQIIAPEIIEPVRPDIAADVQRLTEPRSKSRRAQRDAASTVLDFTTLSAALGLGGADSSSDVRPRRRRSGGNADALLSGSVVRIEDADAEAADDPPADAEIVDAFDVLGKSYGRTGA